MKIPCNGALPLLVNGAGIKVKRKGAWTEKGQNDLVCVLPAAGRSAAKGPQTARADLHDLTQPLCWERPNMFFVNPEPHGVGHSLGPMAFMPSMAREELGGLCRENDPPDCFLILLGFGCPSPYRDKTRALGW